MHVILSIPEKLYKKVDILLDRILYLTEEITSVTYNNENMEITLSLNSRDLEVDKVSEMKQAYHELCESLKNVRSVEERVVRTNLAECKCDTRVYPGDNLHSAESMDVEECGILLKEDLDRVFINIAKDNGALMREYPSVLSKDNMLRNQYHIHFPQNIFGIGAVPHNINRINDFRQKAIEGSYSEFLEFEGEILQPCICYHCYEELKGKALKNSITLTGRGNCFRHEVKWRENNFRKREFTMREIVFIGQEEWVLNTRNEILNVVWDLFESIGLQGRIATATDPFFFSQDLKTKGTYQMMSNAKYELIVTTSDKKEVSIASFNYCQDVLCSKYDIRDEMELPLHSGCVAFGIDRWKEAILDKYGYDPKNWPEINLGLEMLL
jgi:seryl-tRNA synthetase